VPIAYAIADTDAPDQDRLTVLVLATTPEDRTAEFHLDVSLDGDDHAGPVAKSPMGPWHTTVPGSPSLARRWHRFRRKGEIPEITYAKTVVVGLTAGTAYRIDVRRGDESVTHCFGATLPGPETTTARLMFGSCHGVSASDERAKQRRSFLTTAHGRLAAAAKGPLYQLWLGDQVYVDDPWFHGFDPAVDPHRNIIVRYRHALALSARASALPAIYAKATNQFIPDDHEFWNNYPRASFATLPIQTASRVTAQVKRYFFNRSEQPHPYHHGAWGRTAGAAYMAFQSPHPVGFDQFSPEVSPTAVQTIDFPGATVAMVDTRWHRTMALRGIGGRARFLTEDDFERVIELLQRDHLVVLGLAKPIIGALSPNGWFNESLEVGPEDYRDQYKDLWQALIERADENRPTVVLAGDVHHHSARSALNDRLVEFVCSPMALIDSLNQLEAVPADDLIVADDALPEVDAAGPADDTKEEDAPKAPRLRKKPHRLLSSGMGWLKRGKRLASQLANNAQATMVGRDRKPIRYRDAVLRHPAKNADGGWGYGPVTQYFPEVRTPNEVVPRVECPGLASLDLYLDEPNPVIRYRAEFDVRGVSDDFKPRASIEFEWTDNGWTERPSGNR